MSKNEVIESADHLSSQTPDWPLVHFDVLCGRCGQDLHGREEPVCPQCLLEFDWQHVVPLEQLTCGKCDYHLYGLNETRCPECGESFDWGQVLDEFRRRQKPLFEYHWRKKPFRSFMSSWWLAMRPWKLWRLVDVHDPPLTKGTGIFLSVLVCIHVFSGSALGLLATYCYKFLLMILISNHMIIPYSSFYFYQRLDGKNNYIGDAIGLIHHTWQCPSLLLPLLCWSLAGFVSLMLLRQSIKLCRVRTAHIARLYVYSMVPVAMGTVIYFAFIFVGEVGVAFFAFFKWANPNSFPVSMDQIRSVVWIPTWCFVVMSMALGFRRYIKMKHAWSVAVACQIIAFLIVACLGIIPFSVVYRFLSYFDSGIWPSVIR